MKGVSILGVTGSIGTSALAVLRQHPERFRLVAMTAARNREGLEAAARDWSPQLAVLSHAAVQEGHRDGTEWRTGSEALIEAATHPDVDIVINAVVGAAGLAPTLAALRAGKRVALANKETLVCGGPLVLSAMREGGGELIPVDSEHSAIMQCIHGYGIETVERIVLTASGGPFRDVPKEALARMSPADALRHPTWSMGAKVTIDSATLANKALEVIETHFLFGVEYDRIAAVVHPQSIIHSLIDFVDGSTLAQMGFPTMEIPILNALSYPERLPYQVRRFDPVSAGSLTFEALRDDAFPAFRLGVEAGRRGGTYPAVFNAANEVAVAAFLNHQLGFPGIAETIDATLQLWRADSLDGLSAVTEADQRARELAETFIRNKSQC
ncbi:MAG: 1-deoxy-D-xylulose-5-phosphate reductoisomerase [Gemmatimonadota bacterium]|jgi:1-deoxy-D-xylulose-5-phosphate reductoisomerase|nr:1-deoxy-D-xylulose-5-phosphate reductoisomerase [Gemmatimonadota bacterium]